MRDKKLNIAKLSIVHLLLAIFVPTIMAFSTQKKKVMMCLKKNKPTNLRKWAEMGKNV